MKITLLQDFLRSGGTERQTILLANAFAAAGHQVSLVTFRPGGALASTLSPAVSRRRLQPFDLGLDWFAPRLDSTLRELAPDVALCMGRMANCYAGRVQRLLPRTAVLGSMRTGKPLPGPFRRSLAVVRHIVANSREARDTLVHQHGITAARISVIYNSLVFPAESALVRDQAFRAQWGASEQTAVLLCVAMFRPEKNQRELVEIVSGLPPGLDWQLWLGGDGPMRDACEKLVARHGLGARVKFLGFQPNPSRLYAAADVAVHASSSEALSNFLIEAQAHGLPAVAYQAQGIEECFLPNFTGWVIPRDDRAGFRDVLTRLLARPAAERPALAAAARERARTLFDPDCNVQSYLELFRRLTPHPAAA